MSGYIGSKAVLLSTTAANVAGNAEITGDLTVDTSTLFVDSTNNRVGVGTASPSYGLHVVSSIDVQAAGQFERTGGAVMRIQPEGFDAKFGTYSNTPLEFMTNSTERMRIDASGNLNLTGGGTFASTGVYNNTTASAANVHVSAAGGLFFRSTSSLRYKNSVEDASYGLTEVMALRPVTYKGNNDGDTVFGGLIAEEVHDAGLSVFVQYDGEGRPDALSYANMVSLCIKAIQEQQAIIEQLKADVAALQEALNEITDLKARVAALEGN